MQSEVVFYCIRLSDMYMWYILLYKTYKWDIL